MTSAKRGPEEDKAAPGDPSVDASPANRKTALDTLLLWTGIVTGPTLWFVQQQVSFVLVPWVCSRGGVVWLHGVTLVCLGGTATAGVLAAMYWPRHDETSPSTAGQRRVAFMAKLGVCSSLFFALVIVAQGIPNFLLDPCQR